MNPPHPRRCPDCRYLPASATVVCPLCGYDRRKPDRRPRCPYTHLPCDCRFKGHCAHAIV